MFILLIAIAYKIDGEWAKISYSEYYQLVIKAAKAFIQVIKCFCVALGYLILIVNAKMYDECC